MRPRAVALLATGLIFAGASSEARGDIDLRYGLRLEAGAEYDSNPARLEKVDGAASQRPIQAAPALRAVVGGELALVSTAGHALSLAAETAAKRFLDPDATSEDLLLVDARAGGDVALGASTRLGLTLSHYDAFQRAGALPDARDFRSTAPGLRLQQSAGRARFALGGGWRWFSFKPDQLHDFQGPTAFLAYRQAYLPSLALSAGDGLVPDDQAGAAEWEWGASLGFEQRRFEARRCLSLEAMACPPPTPAPRRADHFLAASADVTRTGAMLLGTGVGLQVNDSNSYGEGLLRLAAHLRAALLLPADFSLSGRAELVVARYPDGVPVGQAMNGALVSIEDEGRSTLRLEVLRPLGGGPAAQLEAGARYTLWTSNPGSGPVRFQRQTFMLVLALGLGG